MRRRSLAVAALLVVLVATAGMSCTQTVTFEAVPLAFKVGYAVRAGEEYCKPGATRKLSPADCRRLEAEKAAFLEALARGGDIDWEKWLGRIFAVLDLAT